MATYLQQNLYFKPCDSKIVKKSFEEVLKSIGAQSAPTYGTQCWSLKQDVIFYSVRKTKTGNISLTYKIYMEQEFSEDDAMKTNALITKAAKKTFWHDEEDPEKPCLKTEKISPYIIMEDVVNGQENNRQWIWAVLGGLFALFMILNFNGGITKKITSSLAKADSNNPSYYYGTWSSTNGKIEVTFIGNMTAKCKVILGREPIEYSTEWAVSKDNGVFWGTYYGRGEYNFMTPDGHLYHYNKNGDRYTDEEVYLRKK